MTSRSEVHHANHYSIEASYKKEQILYVELYNVLLFCEVKIEMPVTYNEWILIHFLKPCKLSHLGQFFLERLSLRRANRFVVISSLRGVAD